MGKIIDVDRVRFYGPVVSKRVAAPVETWLPRRFPRAFVPGITVRRPGHSFTGHRLMLRGRPGTPADLPAGLRLLRREMWSKARPNPASLWRPALLEHLNRIYPSQRLRERVGDLPVVVQRVYIHGDATAANLVRFPGGALRWIDPLDRGYIPGDPRVDVAKALQSAWGYERALAGGDLDLDGDLADRIISEFAPNDGDLEVVETWMLIHFARLLRYHDERIRKDFTALIEALL